ncbi:hypothetical protein [Flavobacterium psychrotrophum]|uniref:hypothetical protein n=1 Tax=Flavobacterium psychrotrophum TaxID=2294119 RepID=UPI000E324F1A|nr:hypothetical protein [Flavobacterium psychrotrophum]
MKAILLLCFLSFGLSRAQPPQLELTSRGFEPVTVTIPTVTAEKFVELSKAWVTTLKRRNLEYDISNVSNNSLTISGMKTNAFFYRDRGETHQHKVKLVMKIDFTQTSYTLTLSVPEIYTDNDVLLKYTLPNYFDENGKLKEGYNELQKSLETTVNDIALNYYNFIINYK